MKFVAQLSTLVCIILASLCTSCVTQKKFDAMQDRANRLKRDSVNFYNQILGLSGSVSKLKTEQEILKSKLNKTNNQLSQNNDTIQSQQEQLRLLQNSINEQAAASEALRKKISSALGAFTSDQLTIVSKNGKVYVSMSDKLLFESGSADVNANGKTALEALCKSLNDSTNIKVNIEGHTDTVPIAIKYIDNWALSVARSTAVARILIADGLDPARIITSGRSQYYPIDDNATPEGRAKNRRTEIILEPNLDKILELINPSAN